MDNEYKSTHTQRKTSLPYIYNNNFFIDWLISVYFYVPLGGYLKYTHGRIQGGGWGDIRPPWDFEAKNVPNLINVIANDKFRIRNL